MKRPLEDNTENEPESQRPCVYDESESNSESENELNVLKHIQTNLKRSPDELNDYINKRLLQTSKQYYKVYMEKLMKNIPMGSEIVNIVQSMERDHDGFEVTFTAAKTIVQSQTNVIKMRAFDAIFNMIHSSACRYVHEKVVTPILIQQCCTTKERLNHAFEMYQKCSQTDYNKPLIELQCLLYTIQDVLDKNETVRVPNPVMSRCTQQLKAISEYVVSLMLPISTESTSGTDLEKDLTDSTSKDFVIHHSKVNKNEK